MIFPTNTELDQHITAGREALGGFPSGGIVTLVQMRDSVGATSLCRELTVASNSTFWFSMPGADMIPDGVNYYTPWLGPVPVNRVCGAVADGMAGTFGTNDGLVIIDSVLGMVLDGLSAELCVWLPRVAAAAAKRDALVVFVTQAHHDPDSGNDYFTGEKAFKENSEYIVILDRTSDDEYTKYTASCIWSPTGCRFGNVEWRLPE